MPNKKPPLSLVQAEGAGSPQARYAKMDKAATKQAVAPSLTAPPMPKVVTKHPAGGVKHAPISPTPHGRNMARAARAMQYRRSGR